MGVKKNSFLEKEIQDLLVWAGCDRPNLNSSQSTLSPCVRTRQQKEKNRKSSENPLPAPAIPTLPPPLASVNRSNSERRLR
ncbi:3b5d634c-4938-4f2a-bec2-1378264a7d74-CDS [Sclerotinia trifoliorum]|uniref:3b5d634c-4938-4f2a-bec2-1378264a7d74-CDS n=1 Tax=Sclerotinia trifoliorum TaxID=28548 RepID=A0A8H2W1X8_9HELO|nr:3b5d634c-4938-4f2a-bec2-1378264a7d74-CDS [Sclerotinia trifoliorum]